MEKQTLDKLIPLIDKVTREGKLKWTVDPTGGFISSAGEYTINVFDKSIEAENGIGIRLVDVNGGVIDYFSAEFPDDNYDILNSINENARRSALNIDKALESVLLNLSSL